MYGRTRVKGDHPSLKGVNENRAECQNETLKGGNFSSAAAKPFK